MKTEKIIKLLKSKLSIIDHQIDVERESTNNTLTILALQKTAGEVERDIKLHESLDSISDNELNETIGLLRTLISTMDKYCHVEQNVVGVRETVQSKLKEYNQEMERRWEEDEVLTYTNDEYSVYADGNKIATLLVDGKGTGKDVLAIKRGMNKAETQAKIIRDCDEEFTAKFDHWRSPENRTTLG